MNKLNQWNRTRFENTPRRCIPYSYITESISEETFHWNNHWNIF